jgi:integrase
MSRLQKGQLSEVSGAFYVRYYRRDGKRVSHRLCTKDQKHYAANAKAVKLLRDHFMLGVNSGTVSSSDALVTEFWEKTYFPYVKENLRASTVHTYGKIWKQLLEDHLAGRTLAEYRTHHGSEFLTSLTKTLGRRSLAHVRSLASGIFTHAMNKGLIESNPWREVKVLSRVREPENTAHYTLEQAENIITALVEFLDAQLIFCLAFFVGLRPSEIAALRWEDLDTEWVHVRRSVVRGIVGETKTPESVASLPLIQPVKGLIELWRQRSDNPTEGWVFPNRVGRPIDLPGFSRRVFIPVLGKQWKGLYAGRRGGATILTQLTGNAIAAQGLLRHKSLATTLGFYKKETPEVTLAGMKLLEAATGRRS